MGLTTNSKTMRITATCTLAAILSSGLVPSANGRRRGQGQENTPSRPYTMPEYNSYAAALHTNDFQERVALLDALVSQFPDSQLLIYTWPQYCEAYQHLGDVARVMKYAERVLSSNEKLKLDVNTRFESAIAWAWAYNNMYSNDLALAAEAREMTRTGLELLASIENESVLHRKTFPEELRKGKLYLHATAAAAALARNDYEAAKDSLAAVLAVSQYDTAELHPLPHPF